MPPQPVSRARQWVIAALFVIAIGGIYWGWARYEMYRSQQYKKDYQAAIDLHHGGKLNESINAFQNLSESAPTQNAELKVKVTLAHDKFIRNSGNDQVEAIAILKAIITDESNPPLWRASAVGDFADLYYATANEQMARDI